MRDKPEPPAPLPIDRLEVFYSLAELPPGACKFVCARGIDGEARFCGARREIGSAYCAHHAKICYPKRNPRDHAALKAALVEIAKGRKA